MGRVMLTTERAVLIRYTRDGKTWRGSGLRVAGRFVLTADHCANGTDHRVVVGGREHEAMVHVRSGHSAVDLAVLEVPTLAELEAVGCARVDRTVVDEVRGCRALGFPVWKDGSGGPRLAQVDGDVPTAEGVDPRASADVIPPISLKITNQQIRERPVPEGDLDRPGSPWAGMSGAVVATGEDLVVGVVRGHSPGEGVGSLTLTPLEAITALPAERAARFSAALQVPDVAAWPMVPLPAEGGMGVLVAASQVVVGEIPRQPVAFVVREQVERLAAAVGQARVGVVCPVTGLRGVGKTQVAVAYTRARIAAGWRLVGWVNAETRDSLLAGLARIAERVGVADPDGDSRESARRLREQLETRSGPGLLVFDNAQEPDTLRPFLPATGSTQVVITSTDLSFVDLGQVVDVAAFSRSESRDYLRERTGLDNPAGAGEVAHELGDLPLALAQAAATIRRRHLTYPKYLDRLRRVPVEDLLGRTPGEDYPRSTAAALLLSVQASESADATGLTGRLLRVLATLSPDGVHRDLLDGFPAPAVSGGDAGDVDAALEGCVAGSVLAWSAIGDVLIMHRLVARVLRDRDRATGQWTDTIATALRLLEPRLFPESEAWARREEGADLASQVEALWNASGDHFDDPDLAVRQLRARSWSVRQLRAAADLTRAIDLGERTVADTERVLGAEHPTVAVVLYRLASVQVALGDAPAAVRGLSRAVGIDETAYGADHPEVATDLEALAGAQQLTNDIAAAVASLRQALEIRLKTDGPDTPGITGLRERIATELVLARPDEVRTEGRSAS